MKNKIKVGTVCILIFIIALGLTRITYVFAVEKSNIHSDEIWGYGSANSYYVPFIFATDTALDARYTRVYKNFNEWLTSDIFKDYITVQEGERFAYGSVTYNLSKDNHPPLYFYILHTICSLFPNTYSLWYGFIINIAAFIIMMIFAFRLGKLMTDSDFFALSFTLYLALCDGILNMFEFVRMYALATAIFTATLFYLLRLMKTKNIKRNVPILAFLVFFGSFTHYYFVIAAGVLVFLASIYFLVRKNFKIFFINGFSLLGAVLLTVAIFPATFEHLFKYAPNTSGESIMPPYYFSVKSCFHFICSELFGINISPYHTMTIDYIIVGLILFLAVFIPISFLLRKNEWYRKNVFGLPKRIWNFFKSHSKTSFVFALICVLTSVAVIFIVAKTVNVMSMQIHTDRYLFVVYPALAISVAYIIYELLTHIIRKHKWIPKSIFCIILAAFVAIGTWRVGCIYLFKNEDDDVKLIDVVKDSDVILALGREWTLTCYPQKLMTANEVFVTSLNAVESIPDEVKEKIEKNDNTKPVYLAINTGYLYDDYKKPGKDEINFNNLSYANYGHDTETIMNFFYNLDIAEKFEYIGQDSAAFGEAISIYKLRD